MNPVPVTVMVVAAAPAFTDVGLMELIVGVGVELPPPFPPPPVLPLEPPQPASERTVDKDTKRHKESEGKLNCFIWCPVYARLLCWQRNMSRS